MAAPPSYMSIPIALLAVFAAVVAPDLQQSAAARAEGVAAPAASPRGAPIALQGMFSDFPCFPFLPPFLRDICHNIFRRHPSPPPPPPRPKKECRPALKALVVPSCTGYLTDSSVAELPPPKACCDDISDFFNGTMSQFCLCHVANGDIGELLPAPLNRSRAISVLSECDIGWDEHFVKYFCITHTKNVPIPPMDLPAPPPAPKN